MASYHYPLLILMFSSSGKSFSTLSNQCKRQLANYNQSFFTSLFLAIAVLNCYQHPESYTGPLDGSVMGSCSNEADDVCTKWSWTEKDTNEMKSIRECNTKDAAVLSTVGLWPLNGPECTKWTADAIGYICENCESINICACTKDYCNISTFPTPFHFFPLIVLSLVKIFFI